MYTNFYTAKLWKRKHREKMQNNFHVCFFELLFSRINSIVIHLHSLIFFQHRTIKKYSVLITFVIPSCSLLNWVIPICNGNVKHNKVMKQKTNNRKNELFHRFFNYRAPILLLKRVALGLKLFHIDCCPLNFFESFTMGTNRTKECSK